MTKDEILEAIRRTAEENDGQPLGTRKFFKETGIAEADWSGKHWVRWSDACTEAGYTPNTKKVAIDRDLLLQKYAEIVVELGHVPVNAELQMKKRNDPEFPTPNTFRRTFGPKKVLMGELFDFCSRNSGFEELRELIKHEPRQRPQEVKDVSQTDSKTGYVYLMQFGPEYKIGTSNNVERRFRELKTQMPHEGKIIHSISTGDPEGIEAYWHRYFDEKRMKGEWFALSPSDIRYFKKRKLM